MIAGVLRDRGPGFGSQDPTNGPSRAESNHNTGFIFGPAVIDWVAQRTNPNGYFGNGTGIGWRRDGKMVAGAVYMNWNGVNVDVHIASDCSRRWLTRRALQFAFAYPFVQLGARRVTAEIGEGNADSRRFAEHLGFELECKKQDAHPTGALFVYRMTPAMCRYLTQRPLYV